MKKYIFSDAAATWWVEYQTDGMQTTDNQRILGIRSQNASGVIDHSGVDESLRSIGFQTHTGMPTTEIELITLATNNNLNLSMVYEQVAAATKYTALSVQATPTFSPVAGAVPWTTGVTIVSSGASAIYYTTDGTVPTTASTNQATTPLVIDGTVKIVRAIAYSTTKFQSVVGVATYTQLAAAAPTNVVLAVGSTAPVGGVTNVAIPAGGATDNTGKVTGWVATSAAKIKITVTDAASTTSTMMINGSAYTSAADYTIAAVGTLTVVLTTTRTNYATQVRTFTIAVTA